MPFYSFRHADGIEVFRSFAAANREDAVWKLGQDFGEKLTLVDNGELPRYWMGETHGEPAFFNPTIPIFPARG